MANSASDVKRSSDQIVTTIESVESVTIKNAEIATEMSRNAVDVRTSMEGVAATTEESSASAEEASASTEELTAQVEEVVASSSTLRDLAESLKDSVEVFTTASSTDEEPMSAEVGASDVDDADDLLSENHDEIAA